jgi:HD-GYP domain-containing protein (c-di-GMP phosphodiesterase class II)
MGRCLLEGGIFLSYLHLSEIKLGMTLNQVFVSPDGKMIFGQGTVVNEYLMSCLKGWAVEGADVVEAAAVEFNFAEIEKMISDIVIALADNTPMEEQAQNAAEVHLEIETELKQIFLRTRYHGVIPLDTIISLVNMKIYPRLSQKDSFLQLHTDALVGDYLYRHAFDVALISGYLGRWLGYGDSDIWNLTLAGLMHDIGKTRINFEMLSKPDKLKLEEFKIAKIHASYSHQLLEQTGIVPNVVLDAVLQHHERIDGSGYPYGCSGTEITMLARIVAVADVYDALISNRYYRKGVSPQEAIEIMMFQMRGQLDTHVLACLIEHIRIFDIGDILPPAQHNLAM